MKALKKRSTASAVALVVIIAATLFGMIRSANAAARAVERQFEHGVKVTDVNGQKYTEKSIQDQLQRRADAALGLLAAVTDDALLKEDADALRKAREALLDADTVREKYAANEKMEATWRRLYETLTARGGELPASVESYASTLRGAQGAIDKSHYNEAVLRFEAEMRAFPAGLLRMLGLVDLPETFGEA